ncbi:unnamed protein product [Triticum turgidum subsp. durum]|uniref:Uncharacterized protein n=1 Tax=Triticum turgidum subsp. durum TaxID=4567 RepID=A0A9R0TU09_TRITD|nr:unnamed protein product [Triticum turgidum subsp. durum]
MASSVRRLALAVLVIVVVLISGTSLVGAARPGAARPDPAERSGDGGAYLAVYPAAERREMLMARLLAGPSRRGAGH